MTMQKPCLKKENRSLVFLMLFCLLTAFCFQLICSKSSPLYPDNDWVDLQCFSTVARAMLDGKVLYRDIYEQKGPLIYFFHAAASLISNESMLGVFLLTVPFVGLYLFFSALILRLFGAKDRFCACAVVLLAFFTHVLPCFAHGGSVEEVSLWLISAALYIILRAIRSQRFFSMRACFLLGMIAGITLLSKFTITGFFLGFVLFAAVWYIREKEYKRLLHSALFFLAGLLCTALPVLFYFVLHQALPDFFTAYFYNNLFLYSGLDHENGFSSLRIPCILAAFAALSLLWHKFRFPRCGKMFFAVLCSLATLGIGTYWGHPFRYYDLIFLPFAVFLVAPLIRFVPRMPKAVPAIMLVGFLALSCYTSNNIYLMQYQKEQMPAHRFARHIRRAENPSLLNYGFLDGGFYRAAGILPANKYFCTLNIPLAQMQQEQDAILNEGKVEFIVTRNLPLDSPLYTCVDVAAFPFENKVFTYYLYQRNTPAQ